VVEVDTLLVVVLEYLVKVLMVVVVEMLTQDFMVVVEEEQVVLVYKVLEM
jgi:hypothetical protein